MLNFFRTTFTDTTDEDIKQETYVSNAQKNFGGKATQFVHNYQVDRQWKRNYLTVNIAAEGYDQQKFVKYICKAKNTTPNVDYFTRDELKNVVREFKDHINTVEDDGITSRNSLLDTSTAKLFDEMMNRRRSNSVMKRRQTLIAQETVLNENTGISCLVSQVTQYITSTIAGYVREQSQMITIDTFPMKWRVKRLDSDFQVLRAFLLRQFPQTIIPPLPKKGKKRMAPKQLLRRQHYYQRFLNTILKSSVLKTCPFLVSFLQESNQESFNVKLLTVEADNGPKNIYEFKTLTGDIEVEGRRKAMKFAETMGDFTTHYKKINEFIAKKVKDLQMRAHELADDYYAIGAECAHLADMMKATEIPQISNLYKHISDLTIRNGDQTLHQGELMNEMFSHWFKYQREQTQSLKEAFWLVREANKRFNAQKAELAKNKERLFRRQNVQEWGCPPDKMQEAMRSLGDAEKAFTFMLPNSTRQVNYLEEESAFFTSQVYKEVRRCTMLDYALAREHFVDCGEQMHRHFHDVTQAWGNFLDYYSDLNKSRKEKDEAYVESMHIGEELVEEDEKGPHNEDLYDHYSLEQMPIEPSGSGLLVRGVGLDEKPSTAKPAKNMLSDFAAEIQAEEIQAEENKAQNEKQSNTKAQEESQDLKENDLQESLLTSTDAEEQDKIINDKNSIGSN